MSTTRIVVLAAGVASRMKSFDPSVGDANRRQAEAKAKAMISVGAGQRPFLDYLLANIAGAGYTDAVLVVGGTDNSIRTYYEREEHGRRFRALTLSYAVQDIPAGRTKPLGTADALERALASRPDWKGAHVTVCNSDNLYSVAALRALAEDGHENALIDYDRSSLRFGEERISQFAVITKDAEGYLLDIIEKPDAAQLGRAADASGRIGVSMNVFQFSVDAILPVLRSVPLHPVRDEKELPEAIRRLVQLHPGSVWTIPFAEHVVDLTSQRDIEAVDRHLRENPEGSP